VYLNLNHQITVGGVVLPEVVGVEVQHDFRELTSRATLRLPLSGAYRIQQVEQLFPVGAPVTIRLGYDQVLAPEFIGFVLSARPAEVVEVVCENAAFRLKREARTGSIPTGPLSALVRQLLPDDIDLAPSPDVVIDPWRLVRHTPAEVITRACRQIGLYCFFRTRGPVGSEREVCYIGRPYADEGRRTIPLNLQRDVPEIGIEFRLAADNPIRLTAINRLRTGKIKKITVGDSGGVERTRHYYGLSDKALDREARAALTDMRYDGLTGELTCYGLPYIQHGDLVALTDELDPQRSGTYYVDATRVTFDQGGYRRRIKIGPKQGAAADTL
jgi:hypothetical protein